MTRHHVTVHPSADDLPRERQLAWAIAELAAGRVAPDAEVTDMVINRVIDNHAVGAASLSRAPVVAARAQARDRSRSPGSTVVGLETTERVAPEWAAWANGVAVRELDFH
ncbi:MAG: MmgE/PrpD family protein, partial [Actinomycetaceae bacterium]